LRNSDDGEEDVRQNPIVRCLARVLPVEDSYSEPPLFFVRVFPDKELQPTVLGRASLETEHTSIIGEREDAGQVVGSREVHEESHGSEEAVEAGQASRSSPATNGPGTLRVTLLFLVVASLAIVDVIFAVDSVTAKISSIASFDPSLNLFINLTSSALAMFAFKSLYILIDMLVHMFRFLNYGVGSVLILIGVKLMLSDYAEVDELRSSIIILAVLALSMLVSVLLPEGPKAGEAVAKVEDTPEDSAERSPGQLPASPPD